MKIGHIINPVNIDEKSDLFVAQPITFKSMQDAKDYSKYKSNITHYVIGYEEDSSVFPDNFVALPFLEKSVLNHNLFTKKRKLPLIYDILNSLIDEDIDYIIYTNVDIALMPYFYDYIFEKIKSGSDSLIINRRVINEDKNLTLMYAEVGSPHPGYDCFVFKKDLLRKFVLGNVCIGANWIGRAMIANLITFSDNLEIITDVHVSFHIGDDGAWLVNNFSEFDIHNKKEVYSLLNQLKNKCEYLDRVNKINEIINFMDEWGCGSNSATIKPSIKEKVVFKLIQWLKKI